MEHLLFGANAPFSVFFSQHTVFPSCQKAVIWSKGLNIDVLQTQMNPQPKFWLRNMKIKFELSSLNWDLDAVFTENEMGYITLQAGTKYSILMVGP